MDDRCVWIATTMNGINIESVLRKEFGDRWKARRSAEDVEWSNRMVDEAAQTWRRGDVLTAEQVGVVWFYNSKAEYHTDPFINGGGYPLVSETTKSVLEQFDLGHTVFHPLRLLDPTETVPTTSEPYYLLNVCNKRSMGNYEALGPEGDLRAPLNCRGGGVVYLPRGGKEKDLVVLPEALNGPDIWIDPKVPSILFLSEALASGLKTAGVDKGWGLVRASVGTL
ncbi:hypothetical protein J7394_05045 [Ruegeria sp. R13_0]|uniref:hypothetical protein n=1 Tax=Ruegeria sp. R13_0 TaxID=2821099 RepID=UPI001ADC3ACF|nr:hypothetical protein [Ruegeria sp. R13_0]MBO9433558.1 hypothetical protein [Ruegeria sp. R13_0]